MKTARLVLLCLSFWPFNSLADTVPVGIAPPESAPEGCVDTADGNFTIGTLALSAKRKRESASEAVNGTFVLNLQDGVLRDDSGRIGSIVANYQFQFDGPPPQAGAIYTGGFSVCANNSLALGGSTVWYRCTSGNFMNIYDRNVAPQCVAANIIVSYVDRPTSSSRPPSTASSTSAASSSSSPSSSVSRTSSITGSPSSSISGTTSNTGSTPVTAPTTTTTPTDEAASSALSAPSSSSTGGAIPTHVPWKDTLRAAMGILGAAFIL